MINRTIQDDANTLICEGPKGGPGMREMLSPTSALIGTNGVRHHFRPAATGGFNS